MIYLDYSATTKVDEKVLERFNEVENIYFANPNSSHKYGEEASKVIMNATENIARYFGVQSSEIIYTSGASESNNLAIKGVCELKGKGRIITTPFEHSSIIAPINYLTTLGYIVEFVKINEEGLVDITNLESLIKDDTILVTVGSVNSELGILQPIDEIGEVLKKYPNVTFHSDITQSVGKVEIDLKNVDLASLSGHKFYTFKGIGALIKKDHVKLNPIIHGGKSVTIYRSGTPQTSLIDAMSTGIDIFKNDLDVKFNYIKKLRDFIENHISKYKNVYINSTKHSIPNILNLSIIGSNPSDIQSFFANNNIALSTQTACSSGADLSLSVLALTNDEKRASSSIRVSLSYKTTEDEIKEFLKVFDKFMEDK